MKFQVAPDLTPDETKKIKHIAVNLEISVKELVKRAIISYIKQLEED